MSKADKELSKMFGIELDTEDSSLPIIINDETMEEFEEDLEKTDAENDLVLARKKLKKLINKNETALENIMHIAKESEHPRAFEVVAQLIKSQSDNIKSLIEFHKQKKELQETKSDEKEQGDVNNNYLICTSSDVIKEISDRLTNK